MKIFLLLFLVLANFNAFAQAPAIQWSKTLGGTGVDELRNIKQTSDGGYILGGPSYSNISVDKSENSKGGDDYWVVKLDANGNKIWDKTIGGSDGDVLISLQQTADNGYILGGYSWSNISGDKSENSKGISDYWVVKIDANGNKIWDKTFGGAGSDILFSLQQTADGGYIMGGFSNSDISGDKSENSKGEQDYWVIKTDANGNKIWDKTFGGADVDFLRTLQQTTDGGYILAGDSKSNISVDKSENSHGDFDIWVVKLDANGIKIWDNTIGGESYDGMDNHTLQQTTDGGYIVGGYSASDISGDKSENHIGFGDYWLVKLDAAGNKIWDKTIGGIFDETMYSLQQTADGGYVLGGFAMGYITAENINGSHSYWVVKTDAAGNKIWDKTIGGADVDILYSLQQTADGGYILGGYSRSDISGDKTENSRGFSDYWVVKLEGGSVSDCSSSTLAVNIPNAYAINPGAAVNTVYIGYQPASSITLNASASGGNSPYNYSWSTAPVQTTQQITVKPSVAGNHEFTVTVTDASGCSKTIAKTIVAMDIRTGKNLDKIVICHKDSKGKRSTISVLASAVANHLTHGDFLGACEAPANTPLLNSEAAVTTRTSLEVEVPANSSVPKVTVGPNPNNGNFWFTVSGIEKETSATLFTIDGKVMKQFRVFNMRQEKINGLSVGMYLLNVPGMKPVKIIVQ